MIKTTELRLGNKFMVFHDIVTVTDIGDDGIIGTTAYFDGHQGCCGCTEVMAEGILLIPEVLAKCGFKDIRGEYWVCEGICIYLEDEADGVYFFADEDAHEGNINYFGNGFTFLHQLQNLFFALEGTELEVNL